MEIWCYMVNLPFYWDIGFSGKLKSKICDGISLTVYMEIWRYMVFLPFYYSKRHLIQKDSKIFIV